MSIETAPVATIVMSIQNEAAANATTAISAEATISAETATAEPATEKTAKLSILKVAKKAGPLVVAAGSVLAALWIQNVVFAPKPKPVPVPAVASKDKADKKKASKSAAAPAAPAVLSKAEPPQISGAVSKADKKKASKSAPAPAAPATPAVLSKAEPPQISGAVSKPGASVLVSTAGLAILAVQSKVTEVGAAKSSSFAGRKKTQADVFNLGDVLKSTAVRTSKINGVSRPAAARRATAVSRPTPRPRPVSYKPVSRPRPVARKPVASRPKPVVQRGEKSLYQIQQEKKNGCQPRRFQEGRRRQARAGGGEQGGQAEA
jgi:hypothetical protein